MLAPLPRFWRMTSFPVWPVRRNLLILVVFWWCLGSVSPVSQAQTAAPPATTVAVNWAAVTNDTLSVTGSLTAPARPRQTLRLDFFLSDAAACPAAFGAPQATMNVLADERGVAAFTQQITLPANSAAKMVIVQASAGSSVLARSRCHWFNLPQAAVSLTAGALRQGRLYVTGTLQGNAGRPYTVRFFRRLVNTGNPAQILSQEFLGAADVFTDAAGRAGFAPNFMPAASGEVVLPAGVAEIVTALASASQEASQNLAEGTSSYAPALSVTDITTATVRGRLTRNGSANTPAAGVPVRLSWQQNGASYSRQALTQTDGSYQFTGLLPLTAGLSYQVRPATPLYARQAAAFTCQPSLGTTCSATTYTATVTLLPGATGTADFSVTGLNALTGPAVIDDFAGPFREDYWNRAGTTTQNGGLEIYPNGPLPPDGGECERAGYTLRRKFSLSAGAIALARNFAHAPAQTYGSFNTLSVRLSVAAEDDTTPATTLFELNSSNGASLRFVADNGGRSVTPEVTGFACASCRNYAHNQTELDLRFRWAGDGNIVLETKPAAASGWTWTVLGQVYVGHNSGGWSVGMYAIGGEPDEEPYSGGAVTYAHSPTPKANESREAIRRRRAARFNNFSAVTY